LQFIDILIYGGMYTQIHKHEELHIHPYASIYNRIHIWNAWFLTLSAACINDLHIPFPQYVKIIRVASVFC
jgi:hypothetical protein